MTIEELRQKYDNLTQQEGSVSKDMQNTLKVIENLKSQSAELEKKAQSEDLKISEKPAQIYQKACGSAFLGIGKTCHEVPVPNPEVASEISIRNNYMRQRNDIVSKIDQNLKKINDLTNKQVSIEQGQTNIRAQSIQLEQNILRQPLNVFNTLENAIKNIFTKQQLQVSLEKAKEAKGLKEEIVPILPYAAVAMGILLILLYQSKQKEKVEVVKGPQQKGKLHIRAKEA